MLDPIYNLFGAIMRFIYETISFQNYGIAIIVFTIFTKLLLAPLNIKQMKSTVSGKNAEMQRELAEIQKLFKGDKQRIAEETQKLYTKYGFSPMAGCLPTLLQFPIIIVLYTIVREPITYILRTPTGLINEAMSKLNISSGYGQLDLMKKLSERPELIKINDLRGFAESSIINFNFLGINLGTTPVINFTAIKNEPGLYLPLLLIPILAAVTTFLQSWLMNKATQKRSGGAAAQQQGAGMMKSMTFLMPVMILFFSFQVPASLGLYWIIGNIFGIAQQYIMNKYMDKKENNNKDTGVIKVKGKKV